MVTLKEFVQHAVLVPSLTTVGYDTPDVAQNLSLPPGPIFITIGMGVPVRWDRNSFKWLLLYSEKRGLEHEPSQVQGNIVCCALALHWAREHGIDARQIVHKVTP